MVWESGKVESINTILRIITTNETYRKGKIAELNMALEFIDIDGVILYALYEYNDNNGSPVQSISLPDARKGRVLGYKVFTN